MELHLKNLFNLNNQKNKQPGFLNVGRGKYNTTPKLEENLREKLGTFQKNRIHDFGESKHRYKTTTVTSGITYNNEQTAVNIDGMFQDLTSTPSGDLTTSLLNDSLTTVNDSVAGIEGSATYATDADLQSAAASLTTAAAEIQNMIDSGDLSDLDTLQTDLAMATSNLATFTQTSDAQIASIQSNLDSVTAQISEVDAMTTALNQANSDLDALSADLDTFLTANDGGGGEVTELGTHIITDESILNTTTTAEQYGVQLAELADGSTIAVWQSENQDGDGYGIYAQRYDAAGAKIDGEFIVNTTTAGEQIEANVLGLSDGGFMVTYSSDGAIMGQKYDGNANALGGEVQLSNNNGDTYANSQLTGLNDGGYVLSYQDETSKEVVVQQYDSNGDAVGAEKRLIGSGVADAQNSDVAALADGGYIVTWQGREGSEKILAQQYDAQGNTVGAEFDVAPATSEQLTNPSVTALEDGGFAISYTNMNMKDLLVQRFDMSGNTVGSAITVNNSIKDTVKSDITSLADGGFIVSYSSSDDVTVQRYDSAGAAVGSEQVISSVDSNKPLDIALTTTSDGYQIAWSASGTDKNDVFTRDYTLFEQTGGGGENSTLIDQIQSTETITDTALNGLDADDDNLYALADSTASNLDSILADIDAMTNIVDEAERTAVRADIQAVRDSLTTYLGTGNTESKTDLQTSETTLQSDLTTAQTDKANGVATRQATVDSVNADITTLETSIDTDYMSIIQNVSGGLVDLNSSLSKSEIQVQSKSFIQLEIEKDKSIKLAKSKSSIQVEIEKDKSIELVKSNDQIKKFSGKLIKESNSKEGNGVVFIASNQVDELNTINNSTLFIETMGLKNTEEDDSFNSNNNKLKKEDVTNLLSSVVGTITSNPRALGAAMRNYMPDHHAIFDVRV
ncbi:hypothetical protein SCG7086_CN_00010 [Chlamydiales bacterium SCGC AG-110-P3]|nr:hypothetical protein SCG7086_CN_00010 [Chlamydiales bacterium SCGC AG-110-P3]